MRPPRSALSSPRYSPRTQSPLSPRRHLNLSAGSAATESSSAESPANPKKDLPPRSPLLIESVEGRSPSKDNHAVINGTQISLERRLSASSEFSDISETAESAHAGNKPEEARVARRSRRYMEFLQRQSMKNKDKAPMQDDKGNPRSRQYSPYLHRYRDQRQGDTYDKGTYC